MVAIGIDDKADVQMKYKEDFVKLLYSVPIYRGLSIQIGNIDYLCLDGITGVNTSVLRLYIDDVPTTGLSFLATVTFKRVDGKPENILGFPLGITSVNRI